MDYLCGNVRACIKQESVNSKEIAKKNIKVICNDELVQNIVKKKYDKSLKQLIFDNFIKHKFVNLIYLIIK